MSILTVMVLGFLQNVCFSLVSRSRNRDNMIYHGICAVMSNAFWFLTMRELVLAELTFWLIIPYIIGTVAGSIFGAKVSMRIEKLFNIKV